VAGEEFAMHYILIAMVIVVYVAAFALALDGRFGMALALSVVASGSYWVTRKRPQRFP
jgi:hypothetical protein